MLLNTIASSKAIQDRRAEDEDYAPLNIIACVSGPAQLISENGSMQSQKNAVDTQLPGRSLGTRKKTTSKAKISRRKKRLIEIIIYHNKQVLVTTSIIIIYYQDIQRLSKKFTNKDYPHKTRLYYHCGDMSLTGLNFKCLNTLYAGQEPGNTTD
jgi:hypothetical protein